MLEFLKLDVLLACVALLALGIAFAWIASRIMPKIGTAPISILLVAPLLFSAVTSGLVSELGVGEFKAKLTNLSDRAAADLLTRLSDTDKHIVDPGALPSNIPRDAVFQACRPYFLIREDLVPRADTKDQFERFAVTLAIAIRGSMTCGAFEALVVLSRSGQPIGHFERLFFEELLSYELEIYNPDAAQLEGRTERLIRRVVSSELGVILAGPVERANSADGRRIIVGQNENALHVLKRLMEQSAQVAVVIDGSGRFAGILTWRRLVDESILGLAEVSSTARGAKGAQSK